MNPSQLIEKKLNSECMKSPSFHQVNNSYNKISQRNFKTDSVRSMFECEFSLRISCYQLAEGIFSVTLLSLNHKYLYISLQTKIIYNIFQTSQAVKQGITFEKSGRNI